MSISDAIGDIIGWIVSTGMTYVVLVIHPLAAVTEISNVPPEVDEIVVPVPVFPFMSDHWIVADGFVFICIIPDGFVHVNGSISAVTAGKLCEDGR